MTKAELLAAKAGEIQTMLDTVETEKRSLTADEQTKLSALEVEADALETAVKEENKLSASKAKNAARQAALKAGVGRKTTDNLGAGSFGAPAINHNLGRGTTPLIGFESHEQRYAVGQFALATLAGNRQAMAWLNANGYDELANVANESSNGAGAYLIPQEWATAVLVLVEQYGKFRANAQIVPMTTLTRNQPIMSGIENGLTAEWVGESTDPTDAGITASAPTLGAIQLVAKALACSAPLSEQWKQDAPEDVVAFLTDAAARAIAYAEDAAAFAGTGSPINGIVSLLTTGHTASNVTAAAATSFGALTMQDFESVVGSYPEYAGADPKWYMSKAGFFASADRLMGAGGGNTYLTLGDGSRPRRQFLGYDVVFVQGGILNNTLTAQASAKGLALFGDLRLNGMLGDRKSIETKLIDQLYAKQMIEVVRCVERVDLAWHSLGDNSHAGGMIMLNAHA